MADNDRPQGEVDPSEDTGVDPSEDTGVDPSEDEVDPSEETPPGN